MVVAKTIYAEPIKLGQHIYSHNDVLMLCNHIKFHFIPQHNRNIEIVDFHETFIVEYLDFISCTFALHLVVLCHKLDWKNWQMTSGIRAE